MTNAITTVTRAEMKRLYAATGGYFFEPATMSFFNSRIAERVLEVDGQYVFVTSEKYEDDPRRYSVRYWNGQSRSIDTVGEFQQYETREEAAKAARSHAEHLANQ